VVKKQNSDFWFSTVDEFKEFVLVKHFCIQKRGTPGEQRH